MTVADDIESARALAQRAMNAALATEAVLEALIFVLQDDKAMSHQQLSRIFWDAAARIDAYKPEDEAEFQAQAVQRHIIRGIAHKFQIDVPAIAPVTR